MSSSHDKAARQVASLFLAQPKQQRRMTPNRCLGCGKATRHIFCPATYTECHARYHAHDQRLRNGAPQ